MELNTNKSCSSLSLSLSLSLSGFFSQFKSVFLRMSERMGIKKDCFLEKDVGNVTFLTLSRKSLFSEVFKVIACCIRHSYSPKQQLYLALSVWHGKKSDMTHEWNDKLFYTSQWPTLRFWCSKLWKKEIVVFRGH